MFLGGRLKAVRMSKKTQTKTEEEALGAPRGLRQP